MQYFRKKTRFLTTADRQFGKEMLSYMRIELTFRGSHLSFCLCRPIGHTAEVVELVRSFGTVIRSSWMASCHSLQAS
jgi:hypothetical protein